MAISRKGKIWLIIVSIPVVLVIAGAIALKVIFTGERLKSMIIPRAQELTGRQVAIGDISLSVFPSIALKLEDVSVANLHGEGFSPDPFLTLDGLRLDVKLLPLIRSRVEVTALELERPHLLLEVNAKNQANYAPSIAPVMPRASGERGEQKKRGGPRTSTGGEAPEGEPRAPKPAEPSLIALLVSNFHIDGGSIDYVNHKDNSAARIHDLSIALDLGSQANKIILTGNAESDSVSYGTIEAPMLSGLRIRLDQKITYDQSGDILTVDRGTLALQDIPLSLSGTVSHLRANPVLDLTIASDSLNIAELLSLVPKEYMKKAEGVTGRGIARIHVAVTGSVSASSSADFAGTIAARDASIQYPKLPRPITDITILASFTRSKEKQQLRVENLTARLGGGALQMAMTVSDFNDPLLDLSASGSLRLAELADYYPLEKGTELGGEMNLDVRAAGRVSAPRSMRASGSMTLTDVSVKTANAAKPLRKLNGTLTFDNDAAGTKKLSLLVGESDLTLSCTVKNYLSLLFADKNAPACSATMTVQSNHLVSSDLMGGGQHGGTPGGGTESGAQGGGAAQGPKSTPAAQTKLPQASGKAAFPLPPVDINADATIGKLTLEKFEFTNIRGSLRITKGIVSMQNLALNGFGGGIVSSGSLDLNKPEHPTFDLKLNLNGVEANTLLSRFSSFGQRLSGAMTTSTSLKGALNDTLGLVPQTLEGSGKVGIKNGSLKGFKVNQSLASTLKLPDLETIQFKDWTNEFTVQNGRLVLKDLTITASTGQYVVNGSQGLDGSLDYHLALYLPESAGPKLNIPGFAGDAVGLFKDPSGRLKFDFNVGGTTDNPKVQLDTGSARAKAEQQAKQKLQNALKDKASDALKKLFKKPGAK